MPYPRNATPKAGGERVPATPSFPTLELEVIDYWRADHTFQASIDQRDAGVDGANEFVFYDGPPFANGLPHYGHLLTGYVKDVVPRYQTMRGRRVERRFGWDCHGLPAEVEAEKQLGIGHKAEIEAMGVAEFNDGLPCLGAALHRRVAGVRRAAGPVGRLRQRLQDPRPRLHGVGDVGLQALWDKGLIYQGFRVLAYCWRCETPLSNTETRMDDVYRQRQDPALTVGFRLDTGELALAWTTTPVDAAQQPRARGQPRRRLRRGRARGRALPAGRGAAARPTSASSVRGEVVERVRGADLVGRRYTRCSTSSPTPRRSAPATPGSCSPSDHVTIEDGTGIVHMAPAYGEDDQNVCAAADIPVILTVDDQAVFTSVVPPYQGQHVFEANRRHRARPQGAGSGAAARVLRAPVPALLALRQPADLQGGLELVRAR